MKRVIVKLARHLPYPVKSILRKTYHYVFGGGNTKAIGKNPWNADEPVSYAGMWLSADECIKNIQQKISGDPNLHWLPYVIEKYLAPAIGTVPSKKPKKEYRCLLLGSSEGHMERMLCERGFEGEIVASDIANKALMRAKQKIEALGYGNVTYVAADLNTDTFEGQFDFIIAEGVLHHIINIESCLKMLCSILKPDGYFILVEFEGPVRFQLPEHQVRWINAALSVLPKELRPFPPGKQEPEKHLPATPRENQMLYYVPPTEADVMAFDPSEAVSGPALKRLIPQMFEIIERKGFGGTLLSYMTGHFDFKRSNADEYARSWLRILIQIENTLIQNKILDDEFVFYVLRKPIM
ncbi:MAG: class I SAM-dependent methyltransferase [Chloroflexota bacterium]